MPREEEEDGGGDVGMDALLVFDEKREKRLEEKDCMKQARE